jgi:predicted nucleotidyltransferase
MFCSSTPKRFWNFAMPIPISNFREILRVLAEKKVQFVVVGGVAAALQGAPIQTFDLDLVHSRKSANLTRLLSALESIDAHFREHHGRKIKPRLSHLDTSGHLLLATTGGPLDVLGTIGEELGYDELKTDSVLANIGHGYRVRVLKLAKYVELKEKLGREKDKAILPILRRMLEEKQRRRKRR